MSDRVVELIRTLGGGDLENRLQDASATIGGGKLKSADVLHLVRILTNNSLVVTPIFELVKFNDLIDAHFYPGTLRLLTETAADDEASLHRLLAVPDHVRVLGDKCLFETGIARRRGPDGLDFESLGRKSYTKASQILSVLSQDKRLRHFYEANALNAMSIEQEVDFLRHCSQNFGTHVRLLRELLDHDQPSILHAGDLGTEVDELDDEAGFDVAGEEPTDVRASALARRGAEAPTSTPLPRIDEDEDQGEDEDDEDEGHHPRLADLHLVTRTDEENEELRFRELMAAEKTVLFSALDTEQLRAELNKVVIRQQGAIDGLCDELALYSTGTQDPRKPASYFLIGPTGVGKNYLVESTLKLFEDLWGIEVPYLELEGPEFTYPSDINELKGAARGFIRSDEEGIMTQFHKRCHDKPFSVMLIDEVEKAHPQLRRFFLPIMDRGTMTDNRGKVLHFENAMIFFTSNIGYSDQAQRTASIGYGDEQSKARDERCFIEGRIRKTLSPEFINRVQMIHFEYLTKGAVDEIFDLELSKIHGRYQKAQGLSVSVTPKARQELLDLGYNKDYGARNLAKVLNRWVNIEISKVLKRDEDRKFSDVTPVLSLIREMREGKRPYEARDLREAVDSCAKIQVPYSSIIVNHDGEEFTYDRG
jgi:hypothetical protein